MRNDLPSIYDKKEIKNGLYVVQIASDSVLDRREFVFSTQKDAIIEKQESTETDTYKLGLKINYALNQTDLSASIKQKITAFLANTEFNSLRIEAYTDDIGTAQQNETIAQRRADTVKKFIAAMSADSNRIVSVDSFGQCCYLNRNASNLERETNRRVEIYFN